MTDGPQTRAHFITFTDLIYASLASYGLPLFDAALQRKDHWAVAYLAIMSIWMFYDWYANHYFAIDEAIGARSVPLDVSSLFLYAGLLYSSAHTTAWIFLFLAIRAFRGIVYNEVALRSHNPPRDPNRLRSYNYSSGFMVVAYGVVFGIDVTHQVFAVGPRLAVAVVIWLIAYGIALLAECRFDATTAAETRRARPRPSGWLIAAILAVIVFVARRDLRSSGDSPSVSQPGQKRPTDSRERSA